MSVFSSYMRVNDDSGMKAPVAGSTNRWDTPDGYRDASVPPGKSTSLSDSSATTSVPGFALSTRATILSMRTQNSKSRAFDKPAAPLSARALDAGGAAPAPAPAPAPTAVGAVTAAGVATAPPPWPYPGGERDADGGYVEAGSEKTDNRNKHSGKEQRDKELPETEAETETETE